MTCFPWQKKYWKHTKNVFSDKPLSEADADLINWFITTVIPIVHAVSRTKNDWRPFVFVSGAPAAYSTFVASSNEAFALFLLNITDHHHANQKNQSGQDNQKRKATRQRGR